MHPALTSVDHRPWPLPTRPWAMAMSWHDLLFAHWPVPVEALRPLIPPALDVDTRDGVAWLGVVPFRMSGVRVRGLPALPGSGAFPELNVRTYVVHGDRPGVWFFSLDAASRTAVRTARSLFHLPYFDADMTCAAVHDDDEQGGDGVAYRSRRTHAGAPPAEFVARYRPTGAPFRASPGSLDAWLTERYCLYAAKPDGPLLRGDIHHAPWPLSSATATIDANSMSEAAGVAPPASSPRLLFAKRLDVVAWAPERVA